ncbi:TonB-dependent receptor [Occallatibacter riparius]|uniref:TonB-dependent receptor n=1 Tax=Occallatibacter riparius TaxID=1002689 RepID=A0A9J7BNP4_9BACT|nr:TonB-dependent receptor [Occallatibacter riparius]UWZ84344.1 TonB-dependent receptor [Occallatibacter riparius]
MKNAKYWFLLLPLFFVLVSVGAFAQANSTVTGIVTDQTGAVVPGAQVVLTDTATGAIRTTTSSDTGLYSFPGLNASSFDMKVTAKGFQTFEQKGIVVNISATFRVDPKLTVGAETATITVTANALTPQVDSNVVSTLISEEQITDLATNGRNIVSLATLGLGVSGNLPDMNMPTSVGSSFVISFNGLNQGHNVWMIDGAEAYDRGSGGKSSMMPSQDALSEFQVLASNYPPDYGISSGGTVSMALKSGTTAFHGELWEFLRNDAVQAHNYFDNDQGQKKDKPELRLNIFGGNLGGPFFIPHVYNEQKKKTFFFYNQEWRRIIQGSSPAGIHAVPTADFITSAQDFTYVLPAYAASGQNQVFIPYTENPAYNAKLVAAGLTPPTKNEDGTINYVAFPGNKIPATLIDPAALSYNGVGAIPKANTAGDLISVSSKQPTNVHEEVARVDHNFNDKWQMFAHYIHDGVSQTYATSMWSGDSYPTVGSSFSNPSDMGTIKLTGTITPSLLLEASLNYNSNQINIQPSGTSWQKPSDYPGQSFFPAEKNAKNRLPTVNLSSWGTAFDPWSQPWHNAAQDINEVFGLSVTHAQHSLKFGGGYNRYTKNQQLFGNTNGNFTFNDGWTKASGDTPGHPNGTLTGDSYLDFLMGLSTGYAQMENQDIRHYVNQTTSVYAQDNWHLNNRLSIQYGIRYDAMPHAWERNNRVASFDPTQYQSAAKPILDPGTGAFCTHAGGACAQVSPGLQQFEGNTYYLNGVTVAGQGGTPAGLTKNDYNTVMPRVGFSLDLFGTGKTVLRGGFGTFYERIQGNDIYNVATAAPFTNTPGVNNTLLANPYYSWQNGSQLSSDMLPVVPQGPTTIASNYKNPGVAQYSLGIQHEFLPSMVAVAQFVGNTAWHQLLQFPINPFPLSTSMATREAAAGGQLNSAQTAMARTFPGFSNIVQESTIATGNFNSFQLGLRQQARHGLSFEVDYTYGHEIDSQYGSADLSANSSNPFSVKYDRGSGNLDRRHIMNANYIYKFPFFNSSQGLTKSLLGGWTLAGTVVVQTGLPWAGNNTPGYGGADTVGLGGNYRIFPDKVKSVTYPKKHVGNVYQWVSGDAFAAPMAGWLGGRNYGFGNAGRDAVVGPGNTNFTTSIYKAFAITERTHFEFRAESYNTWNHTQFNNFRNNWSGSDYGQASGARDPRTFQFGGKVVF